MGNKTYGKLLPDYGDLDNVTGTAPGYRVYILENDGSVSLQMVHASEDPLTAEGSAVFMNVEEARQMIQALQKAVDLTEPKNATHKARGKDC